MKISKLIIFAAMSITTLSNATDINLKLNNGAGETIVLPLNTASNVHIESNGNVSATTTHTAEQIATNMNLTITENAPVVNLFATPINDNSATLSWTLNNDAVYCQKSGLWSGTLNGSPTLPNNTSNQVVTVNGSYSLTCYNALGSHADTQQVTSIVTVLTPTVTLTAEPDAVFTGGSTILKWTIGNTPTSCSKSGDWSGTLNSSEMTNGEHSLEITDIQTSKSYGLVCSNSAPGNSGVQTATVSLLGNESCSSQPPILGGNEDTNPQNYDEIAIGGVGFPGDFGGSMYFGVQRNTYVALEFNSGSTTIVQAKHKLTTPPVAPFGLPDGNTYSISECPGDFSTHLNQDACLQVGGFQQLRWSIQSPVGTNSNYCNLEMNKTYYMNFVHSNVSPFTESSCGTSECGILMSTTPIN